MGKKYITTPIYYASAKPHIGHAYTTIAADVLARFWREQGELVRFTVGLDEHGEKVAQKAKEKGDSPQEYVDWLTKEYKKTWQNLNIKFNSNSDFIRTTSDRHKATVQKVCEQLKDSGDLYAGEYKGLYCTGCEKFITEKELVDGKCPDHQKEPEEISESNWFFKLKKYIPTIKEKIENGELIIGPEERKKEVLGLLKQDLDDFSVSRESVKWGIEIPFSDQRVYVWVDALTNYISNIGYADNEDNFKKWWPADIHLMAKDILKFHAVYWPALLLALKLPLPKRIFAHGFFSIDGQKMSKTIGNVIDPNDLVDKYGSDVARYLILSQFPFGTDGDVKASKFDEKYNSDLANGLGNLAGRVTTMIEKYNDLEVPELEVAKETQIEIEKAKGHYEMVLRDKLLVEEALRSIWKLIHYCDEDIEKVKPWELAKAGDKESLQQHLRDWVEILRVIGKLVTPFMPETGEKIRKSIEGEKIEKISGLFPRL